LGARSRALLSSLLRGRAVPPVLREEVPLKSPPVASSCWLGALFASFRPLERSFCA